MREVGAGADLPCHDWNRCTGRFHCRCSDIGFAVSDIREQLMFFATPWLLSLLVTITRGT